jgi:hypothetical protein
MKHPLSAAAAVSIAGGIALCIVYRDALWHLILAAAALRIFWAVACHKLGMRPRRRTARKRSLWEAVEALGVAYIAWAHRPARRDKDLSRPTPHVLDVDKKPDAGSPGSAMLAAGDSIPF